MCKMDLQKVEDTRILLQAYLVSRKIDEIQRDQKES
jgi:hypothetical protein